MQTIQYTIDDQNGIHARPAGLFVKTAGKFSSDIKISKGEKQADGKRLFSIMGLGVKCGDEITVTIDGSDEQEAASALNAFLQENL